MRIEPFVLGPNEYLLEQGQTVAVNGYDVKLSDVRFDESTVLGYAYMYSPEEMMSVVRILEGKTEDVGNATVTVLEAFYRYQPYAHVKIVV